MSYDEHECIVFNLICVPTHQYSSLSLPFVPAIDDGSGTDPAPGPPTKSEPGPAPHTGKTPKVFMITMLTM